MNKKMRMFQALLIVAILLLQMIIPIVPSIAVGETITIQCKDKNFYNAIKEKLGEKVKSASDKDLKLTALKSDVESIDTLYLNQSYNAEDAIKIKDISGIENFKGLTKLDLSYNQISDISKLSGLTNLTKLDLFYNQISDISKLSGLTNLTYLYLYNNQISDISKLSGLTNLTCLDLSNNQISDIRELKGLTNLTFLLLSDNKIRDIGALSGLTNLTKLDLFYNQISDISKLSGLTNLTDLYLSNNQISDISKLSGLTNLTYLSLSNNQITKNILKTEDEVELPQIFKAAKDPNSKVYTEEEYKFKNCVLTTDNTKVKLKEKGQNASVKIMGGYAGGTTLNIVVTEEAQKTLSKIEITTPPTKTAYTEGEKFDKTGMKVTATYSDETTEEVTDYIYTPTKELTTGDTTITVSYTKNEITKLATQAITVKAEDPNAEKTIQCKDKNFYNAIKEKLGEKVKSASDKDLKLTALKNDVESINILNLGQVDNAEDTIKIEDISGIENFKGLTDLDLCNNQISDISALSGLTNLKSLDLRNNQISNISALKGLTNLEYLYLNENQIIDISVLSDLTNLKCLDLVENQIIDISALSDLTNLTELNLIDNQISDISKLKGLTNLEYLYLNENQIRDISVLSDLTNLTDLSLSNNQISDISAIEGLIKLEFLDLDGNKINSISPISNLTNLKGLDLSNSQISDIRVLSGLTNIKNLVLSNNQIRDIRTISGLTNLEGLYLSNNQISDISAISGLTNLTSLYLDRNQITKNILKTEDEVELPQIFKAAKDPNSKVYTEEEYQFENCELTADKTKVKLKEKGKNASVKIIGGNASGTTLNIVAVDEIPKELTGIEIASYSGKIIYTEGEDFDTSTLKIEAKYSDNSSKELKEGEYEIVDGKNLKVGQNSVTIRYTEGEKTVETTHTIAVKAKEPEVEKTLSKIEITTPPTKTAYTEGEKFDKTGMKVIATYSDGTTKEVTDYTYTPAGELKTTDTAITVSYKEGEKTVEAKYIITVKAKPPVAQKTLESIKVTTAPTRTTYTEGEKFDKSGMKVTATYSDGTTKEVTDYTYTPAGELKTTDKTITVSYTENGVTKTATQEITVVAKGNSGDEPGGETEKAKLDSIEIKEAPTKTVYTEGEKFDKTGMKVIAKYSDGTTKEIKNYAYTPAGALTKKDTTITVSYTENGVTKTDTQKIKIQNKDDGTGAKDKFPDTGAQIPIISGIVLMFAVAVASVVKIKRLTGI